MPLGERGPYERSCKKGAPLLKRCYSTAIGSSNLKMMGTDMLHMLLIIISTGNELLRNVNNDDLK